MKRTVLNMLSHAARQYKNIPYTSDKLSAGWVHKNFADTELESSQLATAFLQIGLGFDDKVALLSEGRSNWVISEFALLKVGAVSVPLSVKLLPEEILFRINHSNAKAILISKNNIEKLYPVWSKLELAGCMIIYLDNDKETASIAEKQIGTILNKTFFIYDELLKAGQTAFSLSESKLNQIQESIPEDHTVTICYTSGTTGNPKGIMLTHLNYWANSHDAYNYFKLNEFFRTLIILPLDHSFAHTVGTYIALIGGIGISFVDARGGGVNTLKNIPINLKEVQSDFLLTVPALTGNFMKKITDAIDDKGGFVKWLFHKGLQSGFKMFGDGYHKSSALTRLLNQPFYVLANALIFKKVRQIFGGKLQFCVGGGALLDIKQQRFFYALGTPVYQGYGLTEATPIISANCVHTHKLGTSGKVLPGIECKILTSNGKEAKRGEKGEIVISGMNVMKGYYKNPTATAEVLRDGWLYTGDMGYFDEDGFLMVVGREKALLISSDGEKYSPEEIEEGINSTANFVSQIMLYNDHSKFTSAIITPDKGRILQFVKKHPGADALSVLTEIKQSLAKLKTDPEWKGKFPDKWLPSAFRLVDEPFTEQNLMINSTMKMVRYKIVEAYKDEIAKMYSIDSVSIDQLNLEVIRKILAGN